MSRKTPPRRPGRLPVLPHDHEAHRQSASLAALALVLCLVVGALFLVRGLRSYSLAQDCVLTGQTACPLLADR
jgi:hypothetical protein